MSEWHKGNPKHNTHIIKNGENITTDEVINELVILESKIKRLQREARENDWNILQIESLLKSISEADWSKPNLVLKCQISDFILNNILPQSLSKHDAEVLSKFMDWMIELNNATNDDKIALLKEYADKLESKEKNRAVNIMEATNE